MSQAGRSGGRNPGSARGAGRGRGPTSHGFTAATAAEGTAMALTPPGPSGSNIVKWLKVVGHKITTTYGESGSWWDTGAYPTYPTLVLGVDYLPQDIDPATDIGGLNLSLVRKENEIALSKRMQLRSDKIAQY
eukprot:gene5676-7699_t